MSEIKKGNICTCVLPECIHYYKVLKHLSILDNFRQLFTLFIDASNFFHSSLSQYSHCTKLANNFSYSLFAIFCSSEETSSIITGIFLGSPMICILRILWSISRRMLSFSASIFSLRICKGNWIMMANVVPILTTRH